MGKEPVRAPEKGTIAMQFMILMIPAGYRDNTKPKWTTPDPKAMERMGKFNDRLRKKVRILSLNGLHPLTSGARLTFSKGTATLIKGPAVKTKDVLGGYWRVEAKSQAQLVKLMRGCPAEDGDIIEIRKIFSKEDLTPRK